MQRILSLVRHLPRLDCDVTVLAPASGTHRVMDESLANSYLSDETRIIRLGGDKLNRLLEYRKRGSIRSLAANIRLLANVRNIDIYSGWSAGIADAAVDLARNEGFDLVYTTSPPHSTHLIGYRIRDQLKLPWIMELRDSMTQWPLRKPGILSTFQSQVESHFESRFYDAADGVIFVTESMRKHALSRVESLDVRKTRVITNGFEPEFLVDTGPVDASDCFRVVYTGSLSDFDIEPVCKSLDEVVRSNRLPGIRLEFVVVGFVDPVNLKKLNKVSDVLEVKTLGVVPHQEALEYQKSADCLLLLQTADNYGKGSEILTGKVFEYIASRKPILAITIPGDLAEMIESNNFGAVADPSDQDGITTAIVACFRFSRDVGWKERRQSEDLERYTREFKARQTAEFLDQVLSGSLYG